MSGVARALVVLTAIGLLAGCSSASSGKGHEASPAEVPSPSAVVSAPPAPPSSAPAPTASQSSTAAPTVGPGDTVLDPDALNADCARALGNAPTAGSPGPTDTATDSFGSSDEGSATGSIDQLLPNGILLAECSAGGPSALVAIDVRRAVVLWSHPLLADDSSDGTGPSAEDHVLGGGGQNAYVLTITQHPAVGLEDDYITRTVTALNSQSGATAWTQPLEPDNKTSNNDQGAVTEEPGSVSGQTVALVNVDDDSAFDAATGTPLWRVPSLGANGQGLFTAFDRILDLGDNTLQATDAATGKAVWSATFDPGDSALGDDQASTTVVGQIIWYIGSTGYDGYNLISGAHVVHGLFPTSFQNILATPAYTVTLVDGTLRCFKTGQWGAPLWSISADQAQPDLVTDQSVLVSGPSATLLLSTSDGSTISSDFAGTFQQRDLIDGLVVGDDGTIIEFGTS